MTAIRTSKSILVTPPKLSPAMQQYVEIKAQTPGTILLFRMGDFYELFYEDAETAARVLGLTLTSRDKGSANPVPMAGFPYHQLDTYLRRLIQAGFRAAVCEQMEDPALAKGLVKRDVSRIVTPGTITDDALLDPRESNFLAAVFPGKEKAGLAWLELSTGRFLAAELDIEHLPDELARLQPSEYLVPERRDNGANADERSSAGWQPAATESLCTPRPEWSFSATQAKRILLEHFGTSTLDGFGWDGDSPAITAAGALLEYVQETQRSALPHIVSLEPYIRGTCLLLDEATRRSLELTRTLRDGKREGSLLAVIDETATPMGARLLAEWMSNPLTSVPAITRRLDAVEEFAAGALFCQEVRDQLREAYDLQRLTARVATGRCSPRDLRFLSNTLKLLPKLKAKLTGRRSALLRSWRQGSISARTCAKRLMRHSLRILRSTRWRAD